MVKPDRRQLLNKFRHGKLSLTELFNKLGAEKQVEDKETEAQLQPQKIKQVMKDLNNLVGLEKIKDLVAEIKAFVQIQNTRQQKDLKAEPVVLHMIFKGNPGTGKTTVARILGRLFDALGVLEKGHLKEVERADLVGEYVGHTAQQTKEAIEEAKGGVLFIDEAYALARGGKKDFGKEAIDTLVKAMEDYRDELAIILAGYPEEMEQFIQSNPGLRSRFPLEFEFEDYSVNQLVEIARLMAEEREYQFTSGAEAKLYTLLAKGRSTRGVEAGNARTVRNILEQAVRKQALRLIEKEKLARDELIKLTKVDLQALDL